MRRGILIALLASAAPASAAEPPRTEEVIYAVASPPHVPVFEVGTWSGLQDTRKRLGIGSALALDASLNTRVAYVIASIGVRPFWERYGLAGDHGGHTADALGVGLPVTLRLLQYALWVPFVAVTPQLVYQRVRANVGVAPADALPDRIAETRHFALQLGGGIRLGGHSPLALHLEAGYRLAPLHAIANGDVSLAGAYFSISGRFGF